MIFKVIEANQMTKLVQKKVKRNKKIKVKNLAKDLSRHNLIRFLKKSQIVLILKGIKKIIYNKTFNFLISKL